LTEFAHSSPIVHSRCSVLWSTVFSATHAVWRAARVSAWPTAVCDVHRRVLSSLQLHQYADDCRVYLSTSVEHVPHAVDKFSVCLVWLSASRLQLNASKTLLMWLGSTQLIDNITCQDVLVLGMRVAFSDAARKLSIVIDIELSLATHVSSVCRSGYNQLHQFQPVVCSLPVHAIKMLIPVFISCHLDYCNSLLFGINNGLLRHMQLVQNAAARLVTGAQQCDHVTLLLQQLHGCRFGIESPSRLRV